MFGTRNPSRDEQEAYCDCTCGFGVITPPWEHLTSCPMYGLRTAPVDSDKGEDNGLTAADILRAGLGHMEDRASTYDQPSGERSMGKTVAAFNALNGTELTAEQGWQFMALLKIARTTQGGFRSDNYEDLAAYAGLMGEEASHA